MFTTALVDPFVLFFVISIMFWKLYCAAEEMNEFDPYKQNYGNQVNHDAQDQNVPLMPGNNFLAQARAEHLQRTAVL